MKSSVLATSLSLFAIVLALVGTWLPAHAQSRVDKVIRIGVLLPNALPEPLIDALRESLRELGYLEGRNVTFDVRSANGDNERLPGLATDLVAAKVDLIATLSTPAAVAARRATATIPIVFSAVGDPVGTGLVASLAHPASNATGVSLLATELAGKRLEILQQLVPVMPRVAMLWNDTNPSMVLGAREAEETAARMGITLQSFGVHDLTGFEATFQAIEASRPAAMLTLLDPFTRRHRARIVEFAAQRKLPAIYEAREFVDVGGLVGYGPSLVALQRRAAVYIDRILKGSKPADLPVERPLTIELVINLKTAKELGITVPRALLLQADQLIE